MRDPAPFRLVMADPPWKFGDKLPGPSRGAEKNYRCMTVGDLEAFALPVVAADAILLLWRVASMQEEALRVVRAWGFVAKSEIVWVKRTPTGRRWFGMGRYVRAEHETCLICARGRATSLVLDHGVRSTFEAPVGRHSEKPDAFYVLAERLFRGPRVELFARTRRGGWTQFGDELPEVPSA